MKIGILGTGIVGRTIAGPLVDLGHEVKIGSRKPDNSEASAWVKQAGKGASHGTFADAAGFCDLAFNCTNGAHSLDALAAAGASNLADKLLIDVANPLDFSAGMPPSLLHKGADSLGEQIQRALPDTRVVKTLNTVNSAVMVDPGRVSGDHDLFVCGNDAGAKAQVARYLREWFGWKSVIDLGDISAARGMECYVIFWVGLWSALGTADINVKIGKG